MSDFWYNVLVAPVAVLVRAPLLFTSRLLRVISDGLEAAGEFVPGMRRTVRRKR